MKEGAAREKALGETNVMRKDSEKDAVLFSPNSFVALFLSFLYLLPFSFDLYFFFQELARAKYWPK